VQLCEKLRRDLTEGVKPMSALNKQILAYNEALEKLASRLLPKSDWEVWVTAAAGDSRVARRDLYKIVHRKDADIDLGSSNHRKQNYLPNANGAATGMGSRRNRNNHN
jgi:hypothetical protein